MAKVITSTINVIRFIMVALLSLCGLDGIATASGPFRINILRPGLGLKT